MSRTRLLALTLVTQLLVVLTPGASAQEAADIPVTATGDEATPEPLSPGMENLELVWQTTGGPEDLYAVGGIALDPEGNIWAIDGRANRFQIFSPDGTFLEPWDGTGGDGEAFLFQYSNRGWDGDIAIDQNGHIYVAETGARRVQVFDAERNLLATWNGFGPGDDEFFHPIGIAVNAAQQVYVLDPGRSEVLKFEANGAFLGKFGEAGSGDGQLDAASYGAIDAQGNLWLADHDNHRIVEFSGDGVFLQAFGGDKGTRSFTPIDVAVDQAGHVYIADIKNGRVQVFDQRGQLLAILDVGTTPAGSDNLPFQIAVDNEGHLYVAGVGADLYSESSVQKFRLPPSLAQADEVTGEATPSTSPAAGTAAVEFVWESIGGPEPFAVPLDITIAPDGKLWVTDVLNHRFQILDPDGTFLETWGTPGDGEGEFQFIETGGDVAFGVDGNIYVADYGNQRIQTFTADRAFVTSWGGFGTEDGQFIDPFSIAVDAEGNVFVSDYSRGDVQKFTADGTFLLKFGGPGSGHGQLNSQGGLTIDAAGTVWVADCGNHRIAQFALDGTFLSAWESAGDIQLTCASNLAIDEAGRQVVVDTESHRIVAVDAAGQLVAVWGSQGNKPGQFFEPTGVAVDDAGNVYVADAGNGRIQAFSYQLSAVSR